MDNEGNFIKVKDEGIAENVWQEMLAYAEKNGLKGGNFKKLNLIFENKLLGQPSAIRNRMAGRVEDFIYNMLVNVFNSENSAPLVIDTIIKTGTYDPGPKMERIENPDDWTAEKIAEKAKLISSDKGPQGNFED